MSAKVLHELDVETIREQNDEIMSETTAQIALAALSRRNLMTVAFNPRVVVGTWMTRTIEHEPDVRNQRSTGTCWLQAACALMESRAKTMGYDLSPSVTHLSYFDKLEKCNVFLQHEPHDERERWHLYTDDGVLTDGGTWGMFVYLANKYGIVPRESYPRTHHAKYSYSLNKSLRQFLRKEREEGSDVKRVMYHVQSALSRSLAFPPTAVQLRESEHGVDWVGTPQDLLKMIVPEMFRDMVLLTHAPDRLMHRWYASCVTNDAATPAQDIFFSVDMEELRAAVPSIRTQTS